MFTVWSEFLSPRKKLTSPTIWNNASTKTKESEVSGLTDLVPELREFQYSVKHQQRPPSVVHRSQGLVEWFVAAPARNRTYVVPRGASGFTRNWISRIWNSWFVGNTTPSSGYDTW